MENPIETDPRLREIARFFYALKDPLRLRILVTLAQEGESNVTDLVHTTRVSQPLLSWHLARLRTAGLVRVERDGRIVRYSVDLAEIERQLAVFRALLGQSASSREKE